MCVHPSVGTFLQWRSLARGIFTFYLHRCLWFVLLRNRPFHKGCVTGALASEGMSAVVEVSHELAP